MASEDSDQISSGLSTVHGLGYLGDLDDPFRVEMPICRDQVDTACELLEVQLLRGAQRVLPEERNYRLQ